MIKAHVFQTGQIPSIVDCVAIVEIDERQHPTIKASVFVATLGRESCFLESEWFAAAEGTREDAYQMMLAQAVSMAEAMIHSSIMEPRTRKIAPEHHFPVGRLEAAPLHTLNRLRYTSSGRESFAKLHAAISDDSLKRFLTALSTIEVELVD